MRRISLLRRALLVTTAVITVASSLAASGASADTTGTVSGTLTAPGGAAVANAWVQLDGPSYLSTTTNASGSYTFTGVTAGTYRVMFQPQGRPTQYAYGKLTYLEATKITVTAGVTATVNETLVPTGTITGRFVDAGGTGIPSASVTAMPMTNGAQVARATTSGDGSYTLAVVPGAYRMEFHRPQTGLRQYAHGTTRWEDAALFTVAAAGQTITVNETIIATGSVVGRVLKANGMPPAAGSQVQLVGEVGNFYAYTEASGNYQFPQVPPGSYRISARINGMTMYAPQTLDWNQAQLYTVTSGQELRRDLTFLPTGTVAGRFTDGGVGVTGVSVYISDNFHNYAQTTTDSNGNYSIPDAFGGAYRVHFTKSEPRISQFAYGKVREEDANVFTLTPGTTLTVNDSRLSAGTLRVTARDSITGAQIQEFWGGLGSNFWSSTENGVLTFADIPAGTYTAEIYGPGYSTTQQQVTIVGGQQDLAITLSPMGKLPVTVVDAATNAPVSGVCVFLQDRYPTVPDGCDSTDDNGRVDLYDVTGNYTLLALPNSQHGEHGVQWVGPNGGVGDQRQARTFSLVNGQTTPAVTIRLDRAGSIAGRVTSETGQPVRGGSVSLLTVHAGVGGSGWGTSVLPDGTYRLDGLGPYEWPLLLEANDHAYQWSGGKASRFDAQKIQVTSGAVANSDHVMKVGNTVLTGTVSNQQGGVIDGWLGAYHASTGDYVAQTYVFPEGPFEMLMLEPQQVRLTTWPYWYNGTSGANAGLLPLVAGTNTINLCATGPTRLARCGRPLPVFESPRPSAPPVPPAG